MPYGYVQKMSKLCQLCFFAEKEKKLKIALLTIVCYHLPHSHYNNVVITAITIATSDTSYGCRMRQPPTSCGEQRKTCTTPPNSWQHVDWRSKHGWSTAEEEEVTSVSIIILTRLRHIWVPCQRTSWNKLTVLFPVCQDAVVLLWLKHHTLHRKQKYKQTIWIWWSLHFHEKK